MCQSQAEHLEPRNAWPCSDWCIPTACHLADLLQGLPKGTLCSCYLSRIKQLLALSLWHFTNCASKTACGNEQKTKPVNWPVLKITLWNKKYLIQTCLLKDWCLLFIFVGPDPDWVQRPVFNFSACWHQSNPSILPPMRVPHLPGAGPLCPGKALQSTSKAHSLIQLKRTTMHL